MILDRILEEKRAEVARRKTECPASELTARLADAPPARQFGAALRSHAPGECYLLPTVIAEVKKASPSKGVIREDFDPVAIARTYEEAGAAAISVLTDEKFFQGSLSYLERVRQTVSLPVLRKDFVIDEYQLLEARASGADAALLIVAVLEPSLFQSLLDLTEELGMQALVEVHDEREMIVALNAGAGLLGINNRNLHTFEVSLETTEKLVEELWTLQGSGIKIVSESGISTREDLVRLGSIGVDAVLVGEALMREQDVGAKLRELIG